MGRSRKSLANSRTSMLGRAAANGAALRKVAERNASIDVVNAKCTPHTTVKAGEKFDFEELKKALGYWASAAMHPGDARSRFLSGFRVAALQGFGVRWWLHWEKGV